MLGHFNGDGYPDYVLYNANTRQTAIWYLHNNVYVIGGYGPTLPVAGLWWEVADFIRDGHPDYLLENGTGQTAIWYLSGTNACWRRLLADYPQRLGLGRYSRL